MRDRKENRFILISVIMHIFLLLLFLVSYGGQRGTIAAGGLVRVTLRGESLLPKTVSEIKATRKGEKGSETFATNFSDKDSGGKELKPDSEASPASSSEISTQGEGSYADGNGMIVYRNPDYPIISRMRGEEGMVNLSAKITGEGLVGDVVLEESSGYERLDRSAIEALYKFRFNPYSLEDGNNMRLKRVSFFFRLTD